MTEGQMELIRKLRSPDHTTVIAAVDSLRQTGSLTGGLLEKIDLRCANLHGANLREANLQHVDLGLAKLQGADLSGANLRDAKLHRANLIMTIMDHADLHGTDFFNTDLQYAQNLTEEQLAQVQRLRLAVMPGGERYDGRYNLAGDLRDAAVLHVNLDDDQAMADFYSVPPEAFQRGQLWARENLASLRHKVEQEAAAPDIQLIVQLRSRDNVIALQALDKLRQQGLLDRGALKGADLHEANLRGANLNLAGLAGADLTQADLSGADLSVADLQSASLCQSVLEKTKLLWAGLQGADLSGADLREADLTGANLRGARLDHANLQGANLGAVNLKKADLFGANLTGARNLRDEELAKVQRLHDATLPDGSRYDGRFNLQGDA